MIRALEPPQATVRVLTLGAWRPGAKVGINYQRTYRSATPSRIYKRTLLSVSCADPLLYERSLRALAEEIDVHGDSRPFWTPDLNAFVIGFKRFLFNVLLFLGSLPEEYEPEKVVRPAREKKGRFRPELRAARFLGKEAYRPASRPQERSMNPPGANYRAIGEPAIGAAKPSGKGACSES